MWGMKMEWNDMVHMRWNKMGSNGMKGKELN